MPITHSFVKGKKAGGKIGTIVPMVSIPSEYTGRYILCDGQELNAYTYRQLHKVITNIYGGDPYLANVTDLPGSTSTFRVPNLANKVLRGSPNMADTANLARYTGANTMSMDAHTLTDSEVPSHEHGIDGSTAYAYAMAVTNYSSNGSIAVTSYVDTYNRSFQPNAESALQATATTGHSHTDADTLQPSIYLNYYIQAA
jgi:microcystin-dependent protein